MPNPCDIDRIREIITPVIDGEDIELVEFTCRREGRSLALRLLVDTREGGITLGECTRLNRKLGRLLDGCGLISENYTLEISSPGLDRPLSRKEDFRRAQGKLVRIISSEPINGCHDHSGTVVGIKENKVLMETEGKRGIEIPLDKITKARLKIEF